MATPEAQEDAARQRIIKHMNADHQDSVSEQKAATFA
jgi:putative heme iron utilization protein